MTASRGEELKTFTPMSKRPRGFTREKKDKKKLFFYVLQYSDPNYLDGWGDEEIAKDYGILYKLRKELELEVPELTFRIVTRSTTQTWEEVIYAFEQ